MVVLKPLVRSSYLVVAGTLGLLCSFGGIHTANALQENTQFWTCKAEGVYTTCATTRSLKPCNDFRAEGVGVAEDKIVASIQAEGTCSDQLMRMVSLETAKGRATVKTPCARVMCELKKDSQP